MARRLPLPDPVRRHPWLSATLALVAALLLALLGLRLWINSDSGRTYIESRVDGLKAGRYGTIDISGLSGDPLSQPRLDRLGLSDETGVWLEARNIEVRWSPMDLLSRKVTLDLARAESIRVLRRPVPSPPFSGTPSSGNWSIALSEIGIGELRLEKGVAGPAAAFVVDGRFSAPQDSTLRLSLSAEPLEGAGDRISLTLDRDAAGRFALEADINAPAGGTLATLTGLGEGDAATLKASASGTLADGDGFGVLSITGDKAVELTAKIVDNDLTASAKIDSAHLPIPQQVRDLVGSVAEVTLTADTHKRQIPFSLRSRFASGRLDLAGVYLSRKHALDGPLHAVLDLTGMKALTGLDARLQFSGEVMPSTQAPSADGQVSLVAASGSTLPFERLEGPLQVDARGSRIGFSASLEGQGVFRGNDTAETLAGPAPTLTASGVYDRQTGQLHLSPSQAVIARGSLTAEGIIDVKGRMLNLKGKFDRIPVPVSSAPDISASGDVTVTGKLSAPRIETDLLVSGLSSLNETLAQVMGAAPSIRASVQKDSDRWTIRSVQAVGDLLSISGSGHYRPGGPVDISGQFSQGDSIGVSNAQIDLSEGQFRLSGTSGIQQVSLDTTGGRLAWSDVVLDAVSTETRLSRSASGWRGPVALDGLRDGSPASVSAILGWENGALELTDIAGAHEAVRFAGTLAYGREGNLSADLSAAGDSLQFGERQVGKFEIAAKLSRAPGAPPDISASGDIADARIASGLRFDRIIGKVRNAPEGYSFTTRLIRAHETRPSDLSITGSAMLDGPAPAGQLEFDGILLGEQVVSQRPVSWRLGDTPTVDAGLNLFGGEVEATIEGAGDDASLVFRANAISLSPLLASVGVGSPGAVLSGRGNLFLFGDNPRGTFTLTAFGPVPGVEETFNIDLTGQLARDALSLSGRSSYGGELNLVSDLTIPVETRPGSIARPAMDRPLAGTARLTGNVSALRSVALAYGHDIGGIADGTMRLSGTLRVPVIAADIGVSEGSYEFGTTGLRLTNVALDAAYDGKALKIDGTADGADGGSVRFNGSLSGPETKLTSNFSDLVLYDRDGDTLRASGAVTLAGDPEGRTISGDVQVQSARYSIENLPSARPKAIDVRWKEDGQPTETQSRLRRTLALDLGIKAERRVFITGRGLESEWSADLRLTGTPAEPLLTGQTDLRRGTLDLAGRPFVFDAGTVYFDGPLSRARLDVDAERRVNGFSVSVALTGSPLKPAFELGSTPELPQDEILSRLLFGRSSMDLSALEAAQLANSIARLRGGGSGFDPASELQSALGIDRLTFGTSEEGSAQIGIGQYVAEDVYLELSSAGAEGSSVEVEWEPRPQISVNSETTATGDARISIRWKKDF